MPTYPSQMDKQPPLSKEEALLELIERSGYNIVQENGQRKYGPPPQWDGPAPAKGSEVFVGKIPRDLFEDELVPVFEKIGKIYEVRLMMDFSGSNRGYAFVMYSTPNEAKKACAQLDNYEIRKGRFIGVCKSVDNCRLFVGGIPKTKTKEEIYTEMKKITEGVVDVILYSSVGDKTKNRGFAFVEYENHRSAAMARRKLIPGKIQLWGHEIAVDWAEPEPQIDEETMSTVTVLYVRNLMLSTSEDKLKDVFSLSGTIKVDKVKKLRDFAFVHYSTREMAEKALTTLNDTVIDGVRVEVTWAKPVDRAAKQPQQGRQQQAEPAGTQPSNYLVYNPYMLPPSSPLAAPSSLAGTLVRSPMRGRGAAGMRGTRFLPAAAANSSFPPRAHKAYEVLLEACRKNNWGEPYFQLNSVPDAPEQPMFLFKVTIPGLVNQYSSFVPDKLFPTLEEAKQYAAEYVLSEMRIPFESVECSLQPPTTALLIPPYHRPIGFLPAAAAGERYPSPKPSSECYDSYYEPLAPPPTITLY